MDRVPKLGELITGEQSRDAIHIAVAPVIAGMDLHPGDHIGFSGNAYTVGINAEHIGIVDPFLKGPVRQGDKFYMFLYPNTITSLRHDWTHPAFQEEDNVAKYEPTFLKLKGPTKEEQWIKEYAESINTTYDDLMEAADNYQKHGSYFCQGGDFEGEYISDEFWDKYEIIRKQKIDDRGSFLSCSC